MEENSDHRSMGMKFNMKTWQLLELPKRSDAETAKMVHYVHASLAHWLIAGGNVEEVRGLWHISRVYAEIGDGELAARYAALCKAAAEKDGTGLKDFDLVYVVEAEARANAITGNLDLAKDLKDQAYQLAGKVKGEKDRKIVLDDLAAGNWGDLPA